MLTAAAHDDVVRVALVGLPVITLGEQRRRAARCTAGVTSIELLQDSGAARFSSNSFWREIIERSVMSKQIDILCPQTGLIKTVTVCEEQTISSVMGQLGWHDVTLYVRDHALDPESTFVGRPHDPSLCPEDPIEAEPYRLGSIQ